MHLSTQRLRQSSNLLLEELLSLLPHTGSGALLQLQETGHESLAELLGALAGEERGQVVDADDAQGGTLRSGQLHGDGGLVEGGGDCES